MWAVVLSVLLPLFAAPHSAIFPEARFSSVEIYASGDVRVVGSDTARPGVLGTSEKCLLTSKVVGTSLQVYYPTSTHGTVCDGVLTITVPRSVSLRSRGYSSDLRVKSVDGGIEVNQNLGSVSIEKAAGPISIRMAQGQVRASGLSGDLDLWLGRGAAQFGFQSVSPNSRVSFMTGDASVDLKVPSGSAIAIVRRQKFGTLISELPISATPQMKISMRSETGNIRILATAPSPGVF
ncbi:MAG: hypothetical protein HYR96_13555 [Deltaproteobacteria bacterium]|nr:hypothetical protein [Deltaproteobacteria bacterium]MBI3293929.1 hypothetical protein [Deltaproteobacteria bacterium]